MAKIEFWLEYAGTYSYLSVARIGQISDEAGIAVDWQPFWVHPVREQMGLPAPFPEGSPRARYMWRDLERRAKRLNLPYCQPEVYPFSSVKVGRIAFIATREGWCRNFTEAAFRLHWSRGVLMSTEENITAALTTIGQDVKRVRELANSQENKDGFKRQTGRALERGIFGSPSFLVEHRAILGRR